MTTSTNSEGKVLTYTNTSLETVLLQLNATAGEDEATRAARIEKFELDEGFRPDHPPFCHLVLK